MVCEISPLTQSHYPQISQIFIHGIEGGNATYELESPDWLAWDRGHLPIARLVAIINNTVVGWLALSPVSNRYVFRGVAELSIYIHRDFQGQGIGKQLMECGIKESEKQGIWTLQSGIFPENEASLRLHRMFGFKEVGIREKIGQMPKSGEWRDIVLMERRSKHR